MGRIITIVGVALLIFSATRTWASIHMIGLNENFTGFSKNLLFANMPGLISAILGLGALLSGIFRFRITQIISVMLGLTAFGWALYQYYDKAKYFAVQEGFELHWGLYLHVIAPMLIVIGGLVTMKSLKR